MTHWWARCEHPSGNYPLDGGSLPATVCRGPRPAERQTCKACGHADRFDFHVDDETWRAVVPTALHARVVCLSCFDAFAASKGIDYSRAFIGPIWFSGDAVALKLVALFVPLLAGFATETGRVVARLLWKAACDLTEDEINAARETVDRGDGGPPFADRYLRAKNPGSSSIGFRPRQLPPRTSERRSVGHGPSDDDEDDD